MTPEEFREQYIAKKIVKTIVGLSDSTIDRLVRTKRFPQPVRLSPNRVAFRRSEVQTWLANPVGWHSEPRVA